MTRKAYWNSCLRGGTQPIVHVHHINDDGHAIMEDLGKIITVEGYQLTMIDPPSKEQQEILALLTEIRDAICGLSSSIQVYDGAVKVIEQYPQSCSRG